MPRFDFLIVGAGITGCTLAERLTSGGKSVLLLDRRSHIGGNCHDAFDASGVLVHTYGPHIFHTRHRHVHAYLSRFTGWHAYEHRVLADLGGGTLVPVPFNLDTLRLTWPNEAESSQLERRLLSRFGPGAEVSVLQLRESGEFRELADHVFRTLFDGYSSKQWGRHVCDLDASVFGRVPVRVSRDDRYFTDPFQGVPAHGYTAMFSRMLDGCRDLTLALGQEFAELGNDVAFDRIIYTGRIDEYFGYRYGALPYRSLHLEFDTFDDGALRQPTATVNYPTDPPPFTRSTEFKQITGQSTGMTTICKEFPRDPDASHEAMYPVPAADSRALFAKYQRASHAQASAVFSGRLGTYRYLNMDAAVDAALELADKLSPAASG